MSEIDEVKAGFDAGLALKAGFQEWVDGYVKPYIQTMRNLGAPDDQIAAVVAIFLRAEADNVEAATSPSK